VAGLAAAGRLLTATLAGAVLVAWIKLRQQRGLPWAAAVGAMVLLTAVDLGLAVRDLKRDNRASDPTGFERNLQRVLAEQGLLDAGKAPPRVFLPGPLENAGMVQGWSAVEGYSALAPGRVWRHLHAVLGVPLPFAANTFPSSALAAFGPFPYHSMALVIGVDPRTQQVVYNRNPDPRVYLVSAARQVRDDAEATELMRIGHDFHTTALVERPVQLPDVVAPAFEGHAAIVRFEPERIVVRADSQTPALLVLAEPWFPGWSATVNGSAASCLPANAWMRAVPVPAGKSEVVLTFRSTRLSYGAGLSLLGLGIVVALRARRSRGGRLATRLPR
jgi:hypothetical protein